MSEEYPFIKAHYDEMKDWVQDPSGYFLIRINRKDQVLEVAFCRKDNKVEIAFSGKKPQDIYAEIIRRDLVSRMDHAAYLGKELEKAYIALQQGLDYVQDDDLVFPHG